MSLFAKIRGTIETIFQLGLGGPQLKGNGGAIEARNANDSGFAIVRAADPVGPNDVVNLEYASIYDIAVPTLAALRMTPPPGTFGLAYLRGFRTPNDGGEGQWIWNPTDTRADNTATIVQVTGVAVGRWNRSFNGVWSIKWFGAYGDGTTIDTTYLQLALDTVPGGQSLFFPPGVYLTRPLVWTESATLTATPSFNYLSNPLTARLEMVNAPNEICGPILILGTSAPTETISQVGNIWVFPSLNDNPRPIADFSETLCGSINGFGAVVGSTQPKSGFTFECFIDLQNVSIGAFQFVTMAASSGGKGQVEYSGQFSKSFQLAFDQNKKVNAVLVTTGGTLAITSTNAFPASGLTHLAVTYDGHGDGIHGTLRVFINGVLDPTTSQVPAGSTILQQPYEDFTIGQYMSGQYPLGVNESNIASGGGGAILIGNPVVSSNAKYTATFTPPTHEVTVADGSNYCTQIAMSFNPSLITLGGGWILAQTSCMPNTTSPAGSPVAVNIAHTEAATTTLQGALIENLWFHAVGGRSDVCVYGVGDIYTTMRYCTFGVYGNCATFIGGWGQKFFQCSFDAAPPETGIRSQFWCVGFYENNGSALNRMSNCEIAGGNYNLLTRNGGFFDGNFIVGSAIYGNLWASGDPRELAQLTCINNKVDDEGTPTVDFGALIFGMANAFLAGNFWAGYGNSSCPFYQFGYNGSVNIADDFSQVNPASNGIAQQLVPPVGPTRSTDPMPITFTVTTRVSRTGAPITVPIVDPNFGGDFLVPQWTMWGTATVTFPADADYTLVSDAILYGNIVIDGPLTTPRNLIYGWRTKRRVVAKNNTTQPVTIIGTTGTGVTIAPGATEWVQDDGTNWVQLL